MCTAQDELITYLATRRHQEPEAFPLASQLRPFIVAALIVGGFCAWNAIPRREYKADLVHQSPNSWPNGSSNTGRLALLPLPSH